jgi:transposase InsO family protein
MPWREVSAVSLRKEFVALASAPGANISELCRRFGVSRITGYKWVRRFGAGGLAGLEDRPRRPVNSPGRTAAEVESAVVELRIAHPAWGGRKLRARLIAMGMEHVPSPATITAILRRNGLPVGVDSTGGRAWQRFEHDAPNLLWQMDFKGHFALAYGRCHPLTVLDDHSRFSVGLAACADEQGATVREHLTSIFRRYGMPARMLMDNGPPWGDDLDSPHTPLTVWLMRLGVGTSHGRPYHPQTQGKDERFHRTLRVEVLQGSSFKDIPSCQRAFDRWRTVYNTERPHDALGLLTPASRYAPSHRIFPETLPTVEYDEGDHVRVVQAHGMISFAGRRLRIGKAFRGQRIALRPISEDGVWDVYFMTHRIARTDLRCTETVVESVSHVPEHV